MKRSRLLFLGMAFICGCAGLIGVPDLTLDENAAQGRDGGGGNTPGADGSTPTGDGGTATDGSTPTCDESKTATDPLNCGRCGHDCVGGACTAGVCQPVTLGTIPNAPLYEIVEDGDFLYVSTIIQLVSQVGGIWKLSKKAGGPPVPYLTTTPNLTFRYAQQMAVLDRKLYFVVEDAIYDDAGSEGALWSCDLDAPAPCSPKLVAKAEQPTALHVAQGKAIFSDYAGDTALLRYPPSPPEVFRQGWGFMSRIWVDNEAAFYAISIGNNPSTERGVLLAIHPDAGDATELSVYQKPNAVAGKLTGNASHVFFTAYDYATTTGGIVRRVPRPDSPASSPCDYAGTTNTRPHGIYVDGARVYWTNRGDPASPYANGSVASCALDGCCTQSDKHWTGDGEPLAITGDAKALYWATYRTGTIWKTAKP